MTSNCHDGGVTSPALGKFGYRLMPDIMEAKSWQPGFLGEGPPDRSPASEGTSGVKVGDGHLHNPLAVKAEFRLERGGTHEVTSDKAGWIKTEFIFVPSKKVAPPVEVEVTVNGPIFGIGQVTVAEAGTVMTGNSRWDGSVAVFVVSAPGIAPEHAAIAELYSNRRLRAVKARFLP